MTAVHTPGWIWILLLFGIFPLLIAYFATRKTVGILVPASDEAAQNRRRASLTIIAALAISLAVVGAGGALGRPSITWIGVGALVVAVMAYPFHLRVWIDASFDGEVVRLTRVHPNYAEALRPNAVPI